jgi:hypothetical protein
MKNLLFFHFLLFNFSAFSQQWEWAKTVNINIPLGMDGSKIHLATDKTGDFYLTYFHWDSNFGHPNGSIIAKYDSLGNELWQKTFTSKVRINDVIVDSFGAFYITGDFMDTIIVESTTLFSNGNNDAFLAKFNSFGSLQWIVKSGGPYNDCGSALCLDNHGNVYMTGERSDSAFFFGSWISSNVSNMTVSKYDSSGNPLLFKSSNTPDSLKGSSQGERIKLDYQGNIIILGNFTHIQIDSTLLINGGMYGAQFICKLDSTLQMKWIKEVSSSTEKFNDITIGDDNTIFVTGGGGWTNGSWTLTSRLDTLGNSLWNNECDLHCGYYVDGILNGITNDSANILAYGNGQCNGLLLVKYNMEGTLLYLDTTPANGYIKGKCIARTSKEKYLISGFIDGDIRLGNDSLHTSSNKIFIAKFSDSEFITTIEKLKNQLSSIKIFPNPSPGIFTIGVENSLLETNISVCDVLGKHLLKQTFRNTSEPTIDLSGHPKGIYFIEIVSNGTKSINRIVVQ